MFVNQDLSKYFKGRNPKIGGGSKFLRLSYLVYFTCFLLANVDTTPSSRYYYHYSSKNGTSLKEGEIAFENEEDTLKQFDSNWDGRLIEKEFGKLCEALFTRGKVPYNLSWETLQMFFTTFDKDSNGFIERSEFTFCFNNWIRKIVKPASVLIVVDVQNDFVSGSLAVMNGPARQDGSEVIGPINHMLQSIPFQQVFYTKDWHPANHISFIENVFLRPFHNSSNIQDPSKARARDTVVFRGKNGEPTEQILWPRHCVKNTWGAAIDYRLNIAPGSIQIEKGTDPDVDSYSGFMDNNRQTLTDLKNHIDQVGATDVYVCGLVHEVCVGATSFDSLRLGYRTILVQDATRGFSLAGIENTNRKIMEEHGVITMTSHVEGMVKGVDRRPELGMYLAVNLRNKQ